MKFFLAIVTWIILACAAAVASEKVQEDSIISIIGDLVDLIQHINVTITLETLENNLTS
jgi:hypothetical protein